MAWAILLVAAGFEVAWAVGLKYTEGFTRIGPTILTIVLNIIGMWLLALAMRTIPIGTAYAVWTGIGVVATVTGGIVLFGEMASPARLACVGLILTGIIGLHVIGSS